MRALFLPLTAALSFLSASAQAQTPTTDAPWARLQWSSSAAASRYARRARAQYGAVEPRVLAQYGAIFHLRGQVREDVDR